MSSLSDVSVQAHAIDAGNDQPEAIAIRSTITPGNEHSAAIVPTVITTTAGMGAVEGDMALDVCIFVWLLFFNPLMHDLLLGT